MLSRSTLACLAVGVLALSFSSCARKESPAAATPVAVDQGGVKEVKVTRAVCILTSLGNSSVKGVIRFTQKGDKVEISGEVTGLKPGMHGFHIHEFGDLTDLDMGKSAGGHFNPTGMKHGGPNDAERHAGDLGNLEAKDDGKATVSMMDTVIQLNGPASIIGRGIIVHADPDDLKTQPTGNAGGRVAAGVIGVAQPEAKKQ